MFEGLNKEQKGSYPIYHLMMKFGMSCFLGAAAFFLIVWTGIWFELEWLRITGMVLFALSILVGFISYLAMFPMLIFYMFKKKRPDDEAKI